MSISITKETTVLVVGAGIMGAGIAQIAAQAGHTVFLYDTKEGASADAKTKLAKTLDGLVSKGKLDATAAEQAIARIQALSSLEAASSAGLVVEAIIENLEVKRGLFRQLEVLLGDQAILATNTSSISVTAIANGMQHPERLVGMHFFNPVPLMKLVEVVSGLQTKPEVAAAIFELSKAWGKVPVHARSTPGFIVNRIARPFYAENLALLHEQAVQPYVLDACLRAVGFRMGPCELMDLIGLDTNFSVTRSVYEANFFDKRYVPSPVQRDLVDGGLFGRKTGQGFYDYREGAAKPEITPFAAAEVPAANAIVLHGSCAVAKRFADALTQASVKFSQANDSDWTGLEVDGAQLRLTDGRPASQLGAELAVFDLPVSIEQGSPLAYAVSNRASAEAPKYTEAWLRVLGFNPQQIADAPGLIVARTLAMLINEAADAVQQGVCTEAGADAAMKLGVNYPAGPFEWLARWDATKIVQLLDALDAFYRGERYRASPWLRLKAWQEAKA
ncbi:MAG: 3-hydroxyacyl-CoA dehydrogenase [Thiothrix sp.]|nr:MAG: 3-hydroxyacyl-CoA dehydrogenase [Thiothrix sp.]